MLGLIKANLPTTGKPHLRNGTPSRLLNFGALNTLLRERSHLGLQVFAHEVEFVNIPLRRMECGFYWRQGENRPAVCERRKSFLPPYDSAVFEVTEVLMNRLKMNGLEP